ncbi:MAG: TolC family protein [Bacteroidales bacterium]|nr:TolC family protein [Bacteroidales bacterium]
MLCVCIYSQAQEQKFMLNKGDLQVFSLMNAIAEGLDRNYSILLARNSEQESSNNATIGNAGMLPSVTLNGTITPSVANSKMHYFTELSRPDQNRTGAKSSNMNANIALNWTVFDGLTMFANYHRLQELERMGEENLRAEIQLTVSSIINAYFDIVSQQQQIAALQHILQISRQRMHSANDLFQGGKVSKVDLLSAQVDYNADTASYIQQMGELQSAKIRLNKLLTRDIITDFAASDSIVIDQTLNYGKIHDKAIAENPDVTLSRMSVNVSTFALKAIQGERYPQVRLTSSYTLTDQKNGTGMIETQKSQTFNYGVTASIPLFNGLNINRRIKNAQLEKEAADLRYEEIQKEIEAQVATAFSAYEVNRKLAAFEADNLKLAAENLDISIQRYKFGAISAIELRDVQRSYINSTNRMIVSVFNAKVAETALKLLTGEVMKL